MKFFFLTISLLVVIFNSCTNENSNTVAAAAFAKKIKETPKGVILDVRTPEEYAEGHIENSINYNWNSDDFDNQIAKLDKQKVIFVYCLSGGRSSSAVAHLRSKGFKKVVELRGGISNWISNNLPVVL